MKVCQINCVYGEGSTGKIVRDVHMTLQSQSIESIVITPTIPASCISDRSVYAFSNKYISIFTAVYRRLLGRQFDGAHIQTSRIINILKREQPDVVHLHCINGNNINIYRIYDYLSSNNIKTILTLHAEFPYTGGCGHAYDCEKWKTGCGNCPILREATQSYLFDNTARTWAKLKSSYGAFASDQLFITAVSPWLMSRALQSPFLKRFHMGSVLNGVDANVFRPYKSTKWRERLGFQNDEKMIFHATANFSPHEVNLKGGNYILKLAEMLKDEKLKFVVAANYATIGKLPENIIYIGRTKNQIELAELYSEADLALIVSKRETFSMPVAESLCCGTPIVGFEAGGPESIAIPEYSKFVEYGNVEKLTKVIKEKLTVSHDNFQISKVSHTKYSKEVMTQNFVNLYKSIVK